MKAWVLRKPGSLGGAISFASTGLLRAASRVPVKTEVELFAFNDAPLALKMLKEGKINGAAVLSMA